MRRLKNYAMEILDSDSEFTLRATNLADAAKAYCQGLPLNPEHFPFPLLAKPQERGHTPFGRVIFGCGTKAVNNLS